MNDKAHRLVEEITGTAQAVLKELKSIPDARKRLHVRRINRRPNRNGKTAMAMLKINLLLHSSMIQVGTILSQPIPKYKSSHVGSVGGLAIILSEPEKPHIPWMPPEFRLPIVTLEDERILKEFRAWNADPEVQRIGKYLGMNKEQRAEYEKQEREKLGL